VCILFLLGLYSRLDQLEHPNFFTILIVLDTKNILFTFTEHNILSTTHNSGGLSPGNVDLTMYFCFPFTRSGVNKNGFDNTFHLALIE